MLCPPSEISLRHFCTNAPGGQREGTCFTSGWSERPENPRQRGEQLALEGAASIALVMRHNDATEQSWIERCLLTEYIGRTLIGERGVNWQLIDASHDPIRGQS
jgi:hypothetical protein